MTKRNAPLAVVGSVALGLMLASPTVALAQNHSPADQVRAALSEDPSYSAVTVEQHNSTVTLQGEVESEAAASRAIDLAKRAAGADQLQADFTIRQQKEK